MMPSVVVESKEAIAMRRRRTTGWRACFRRYGAKVVGIVALIVLVDMADDWMSHNHHRSDLQPAEIQNDYSSIQSIQDLQSLSTGQRAQEKRCHVSTEMTELVFQHHKKKWDELFVWV